MASLFLIVVRLHMKKRCEPGSRPYQMVHKTFKPVIRGTRIYAASL
jgi:hypothetical protein